MKAIYNPNFSHYRCFKTAIGNTACRPENPHNNKSLTPSELILYNEFEEWVKDLTFHCFDSLKPGLYDKSNIDIVKLQMHVSEKYVYNDPEIPVLFHPTERGEIVFVYHYTLYVPSEYTHVIITGRPISMPANKPKMSQKEWLKKVGLSNQHNVTEFVKEFIDFLPKRLEYACHHNLDKTEQRRCNHLDFIEYHYRSYLSGLKRAKTLLRVNNEIREYLDAGFDAEHIAELLKSIKDVAIKNEFYEHLSKIEKSTARIKKTFKI